jgi:pimeloyl-ACP methyl ester carboxylesterase
MYDILTQQRTAPAVFAEIFPDMDEAGIQYLDGMIHQVDPEYIKVLLEDRSFEDLDVPAMLEKVTCPTLLLYGELEKGAVVRDRDVEFFLNHVPNGTAIQIKNAGHLLQIDQPARVLELIEEFTAKLH